jgi:hypothetical protein
MELLQIFFEIKSVWKKSSSLGDKFKSLFQVSAAQFKKYRLLCDVLLFFTTNYWKKSDLHNGKFKITYSQYLRERAQIPP